MKSIDDCVKLIKEFRKKKKNSGSLSYGGRIPEFYDEEEEVPTKEQQEFEDYIADIRRRQ